MIDPEQFWKLWTRLCKRFNRAPDKDEAMDYLGYLDARGMDTDEALREGEAAWAVREFFPRPADFFARQAASGWRAILDAVPHCHAHAPRWDEFRARIPARAWLALQSLGGMATIAQGQTRNLIQTRDRFFDAFDRTLIEDAGDLTALLSPVKVAQLPDPSGCSFPLGSLPAPRVMVDNVTGGPQRVSVQLGR